MVGSGIAAARLSPDDTGLQLLENAVATGAVLFAVLLALGPVSGGHLNPVVSLVDVALGRRDVLAYLPFQLGGAALGAIVANLMFELPAVEISATERPLWFAEGVATFGLVLVVLGVARSGRPGAAPAAVAAYITGAYFFTASTSFANPAVTVGRMLTDTFAGIAPESVPAFVAAQLVGGALGALAARLLYHDVATAADNVVVPHEPPGQ